MVHLAAVGQADIESGRPMEKNTLFSIASMTKPLVATAVMVLQDEGKLNVEDNVSKYIPEFASLKLNTGARASRAITIRDLLTHTSGLAGSHVTAPRGLENEWQPSTRKRVTLQPTAMSLCMPWRARYQAKPNLPNCSRTSAMSQITGPPADVPSNSSWTLRRMLSALRVGALHTRSPPSAASNAARK